MKIRITKRIDKYFVGQVVDISNNDAHTLVDKGYATTSLEKGKYKNKMMVSEK